MTRNYREVPALEALMQGMTPEQIDELQEICAEFEGGYDELISHLSTLGAQPNHYAEVNGEAKRFMGKSRTDADLLNRLEMLTWAIGYQLCTQIIIGLSQLTDDTRNAFTEAAEQARSDQ